MSFLRTDEEVSGLLLNDTNRAIIGVNGQCVRFHLAVEA